MAGPNSRTSWDPFLFDLKGKVIEVFPSEAPFLAEMSGFDAASGKFAVDRAKIEGSVRELATRFLILEGDGDYAKAQAFIARYGTMDAPTKAALDALKDIPVDIAPIYKTVY